MYIPSGNGNTVNVNKREKNNYLSSPFFQPACRNAGGLDFFAKKLDFIRVLEIWEEA